MGAAPGSKFWNWKLTKGDPVIIWSSTAFSPCVCPLGKYMKKWMVYKEREATEYENLTHNGAEICDKCGGKGRRGSWCTAIVYEIVDEKKERIQTKFVVDPTESDENLRARSNEVREFYLKDIKCTKCKWQGSRDDLSSIFECGEDTCPKCGEHRTLKEVPT